MIWWCDHDVGWSDDLYGDEWWIEWSSRITFNVWGVPSWLSSVLTHISSSCVMMGIISQVNWTSNSMNSAPSLAAVTVGDQDISWYPIYHHRKIRACSQWRSNWSKLPLFRIFPYPLWIIRRHFSWYHMYTIWYHEYTIWSHEYRIWYHEYVMWYCEYTIWYHEYTIWYHEYRTYVDDHLCPMSSGNGLLPIEASVLLGCPNGVTTR